MKTEQFKKTLNKLRFLLKIPIVLAQHFILTCLSLFLFSLVLGGFLFYNYVVFAQRTEVAVLQKASFLKEEVYKEVIKTWQDQENRFNAASSEEYPDPFK